MKRGISALSGKQRERTGNRGSWASSGRLRLRLSAGIMLVRRMHATFAVGADCYAVSACINRCAPRPVDARWFHRVVARSVGGAPRDLLAT